MSVSRSRVHDTMIRQTAPGEYCLKSRAIFGDQWTQEGIALLYRHVQEALKKTASAPSSKEISKQSSVFVELRPYSSCTDVLWWSSSLELEVVPWNDQSEEYMECLVFQGNQENPKVYRFWFCEDEILKFCREFLGRKTFSKCAFVIQREFPVQVFLNRHGENSFGDISHPLFQQQEVSLSYSLFREPFSYSLLNLSPKNIVCSSFRFPSRLCVSDLPSVFQSWISLSEQKTRGVFLSSALSCLLHIPFEYFKDNSHLKQEVVDAILHLHFETDKFPVVSWE